MARSDLHFETSHHRTLYVTLFGAAFGPAVHSGASDSELATGVRTGHCVMWLMFWHIVAFLGGRYHFLCGLLTLLSVSFEIVERLF